MWVHPDIRGHVYQYYIPYVRDAVARGYVVIAPEYRGSVGYGKDFYDAIDYGGAEVDDVLTAVDYLKTMPHVDPARIGIIGWSHGGMITLLSITREPTTFKAAAALVPVTNLFQRLAWKGVEQQHRIDPANRYGGLPERSAEVYKARSPIYQIDKLQIPLLVHVTKNDGDVEHRRGHAARRRAARRASRTGRDQGLRQSDRRAPVRSAIRSQRHGSYRPINTREQRDSWNRVWTFLDWHLDLFHAVQASTRQRSKNVGAQPARAFGGT